MVKTTGKKLENVSCIVCGKPANCSSKFLSKPEEYRCREHYEEYLIALHVNIRSD